MIGQLFGLASAGKTNAKGMPGLLRLALIGREFQDVIRFTRPPRAVQTMMFGLLRPVGRLRGYRGLYPEYSRPHGRTTPDSAVLAIAGLGPPDNPGPDSEALPALATARHIVGWGVSRVDNVGQAWHFVRRRDGREQRAVTARP